MKKILLALSFLAMVCVADLLGQGPLTNALNLRVRTDANGSLVATGSAYTAPDGPLTALGNIRLRTDANGYLITTSSPTGSSNTVYAAFGTSTAPGFAWAADPTTGWYGSAGIFRLSCGNVANCVVLTNGAASVNGTFSTTALGIGGATPVNGMVGTASVAFASLGTPASGTFVFCADCAPTTPATCPATKASCVCTSGGTGALAVRLNSVWDCGTFQ